MARNFPRRFRNESLTLQKQLDCQSQLRYSSYEDSYRLTPRSRVNVKYSTPKELATCWRVILGPGDLIPPTEAFFRKGKGLPRDCRRRQEVPAFTLGPSRAKGRRARMKRQPIKERTEWSQPRSSPRRACTRSRMYRGIKKGAVAFVRSSVANQREAATVHRPTADYRFSASRYRTSREIHQAEPHPPPLDRRGTLVLESSADSTCKGLFVLEGRFLITILPWHPIGREMPRRSMAKLLGRWIDRRVDPFAVNRIVLSDLALKVVGSLSS